MSSHVINQINAHYDTFTPSYRKIADYVKKHCNEAQYLSISGLADECKVAEATLFRFCKALGFSGYNEFRLALAHSSAQSDVSRTYLAYGRINIEDSVEEMCRKLYTANINSMQETLSFLNPDTITRAGTLLLNARKVFCFGQGSSLIVAMEAWSRFLTISSKFFTIQDSHMQIMAASLLEEQDVILFVSYSGSTLDAQNLLPRAKERGAKVILITHFQDSAAAQYADEVLVCGGYEAPLQSGSIAAKMAMLFIVDVLVNEFSRRDAENSMKNKDLTCEALASRHL